MSRGGFGRTITALSLVLAGPPAVAACLTVPAPSSLVTSLYGWRFHPVMQTWRMHRGVDLRAEMGTTLVAAHGGVAQIASSAGGGNELRIIGQDGTVTRYLHLTRAIVEPGATIKAGQEVAISGNSGHASAAPHLHLEVYPGGLGTHVNPEPMLCPSPARKAGAEQVEGFPIMACRPEAGASCKPSAVSPSVPPIAGAGAIGGPVPQEFDDMSTAEILSSEVMKRFANPDWYVQLQSRTVIPLLAEYLHMLALEGALALERSRVRERIESLLAVRLARSSKREISARLERQHDVTVKAGR